MNIEFDRNITESQIRAVFSAKAIGNDKIVDFGAYRDLSIKRKIKGILIFIAFIMIAVLLYLFIAKNAQGQNLIVSWVLIVLAVIGGSLKLINAILPAQTVYYVVTKNYIGAKTKKQLFGKGAAVSMIRSVRYINQSGYYLVIVRVYPKAEYRLCYFEDIDKLERLCDELNIRFDSSFM